MIKSTARKFRNVIYKGILNETVSCIMSEVVRRLYHLEFYLFFKCFVVLLGVLCLNFERFVFVVSARGKKKNQGFHS